MSGVIFVYLFFLTCIPYVVLLWGWDWYDVLAHSLLFIVSVRPTGPLPAFRPAGTAESVVASATQRVKWTLTNDKNKKNKKNNSWSIPVLLSSSFCLQDLIYGLIVLFLRKTVVIAKMIAALLWRRFTCTDGGCIIAGNTACLVPKLQ